MSIKYGTSCIGHWILLIITFCKHCINCGYSSSTNFTTTSSFNQLR